MATLQDLFNEIQADSRISNPPTFEDFQSKMEDPAYAERVNEILGRNGYDVNAYEGLKKKEESMVESAPLSQQESEQPSETTEPTQTVGTEPTQEVVTEQVIEKPVFSAPAPINTISPFKKKKPQETKEELAAKAVPFDDSYNVSMGYFNPTTNKVEVLVEPKEEGSFPYTQVVDAGDPWLESVKKTFPGMAMYADEKEWKTASAQKMAKEENAIPPTSLGALPMTPVDISGRKAGPLGKIIQKTFGWDDARLEQFYTDQDKRKANRTPLEVWGSEFNKFLKGSKDVAEIQQAKEWVKQENIANATAAKEKYEFVFSNGRSNLNHDKNAILEEYATNPDAAYSKFKNFRSDVTLDYYDAEERYLNNKGEDQDQIRFERSKYEALINDERNGKDLDRVDEQFIQAQESRAMNAYSNTLGSDVTLLTSTKEYEKASKDLRITNFKIVQAQKRLQELGYDVAGKAIEEQGKTLTQQQIEAKKYADEMTSLNDDYEEFTTPLTSRQDVINKRIEELQTKGEVTREEEAEYSQLVEEFNAINEQVNAKTLNYTTSWGKAQENYNKYYTESNALYQTIKEQEKKINDPEVQALVKIINNANDEKNFVINQTGVDAAAISDLTMAADRVDLVSKLNERSKGHEESSVNRFDDIREREKMDFYINLYGKVADEAVGSPFVSGAVEFTKGAVNTAYKMASGLLFSPVYIANLFAADDEYSEMDRVTETLSDASTVLDPFTSVRSDADMVDKILNATGGAAVQMAAMATGSGVLMEGGMGVMAAQTVTTFMSSFPMNYQDNINSGMNPMDARNIALMNTATDVLLEGIYGEGKIYKAIRASRSSAIKEGIKAGKNVDEIMADFYKSLPKEVADKAKDVGVRAVAIVEGAALNAFEETTQMVGQKATNRAYNYINDGSVAEVETNGEEVILTTIPALLLGGAGNATIDIASTQSRDALSEGILYVGANSNNFLSEIEKQVPDFYNENKKQLEEISMVAKESQKLPGYANLDANLKAHVLSETIRKKNLEAAMKNFGLEDPKTKEEIANIDTEIKQILAGEKTSTITETPQENAVQEPSTGEVLQRQPQEVGEAGSQRKGVEPVLEGEGTTQEVGKEEIVATPQEAKEQEAMQNDIDQVQQSTGTVINLNEDGTLTINAPQRGGQSKKDAAIENAKQELTNLGYNVESRVVQPTQQEVVQEEVQPEITDEEFDNSIKEAEGMGVVAGSEAIADLQTRTAQDPKKGKIVSQASRAVQALKSLFPNMNIVLHENDESYNNAMGTLGGTANTRGQFVYKPTADGNIQGAVHINLDRANARTIAHEVTHAALLKMFKGDGKVFGNFKDKLKDIAKNQKMVITDKEGNQVETTWGDEAEKLSSRYQTEDQAEEYLSELAGLVAEMDTENPTNKSILQKIAEFINKFILSNPQLNALGIKPITDTSSAEEVLEFFDTLGKKISRGEEIKEFDDVNSLGLSGKVNVSEGVKSKSSIDSGEIKRFPVNPNTRVEEGVPLEQFNGKRVNLMESDRMTGGYISDSEGNPLFKFYGGVFYPVITGKWWASRNKMKAKGIAENANKNRDKDGYIYSAPMIGSDKQHMSNTDMLTVTVELMKFDANSKTSKVKKADVISYIDKAFSNKSVQGKKAVVKTVLKKSNNINELFNELEFVLFQEGDKILDKNGSPILDENKKPISNFTFEERLAIVNSILGDPKVKEARFPSAGSISDAAKRFEEPITAKANKIGDLVTIMRTKGTLQYKTSEVNDDFYHKSYPEEIYAVNEDGSPAEIEVYVLEGAYSMNDVLPSLTQSSGKEFTWDEYLEKHKSENLAIAQYNRTAKLSSASGEIKSGVKTKSQMDDVQRTAQMYNMSEQGFFPKNADEFKINKDFEKFGLKSKRANPTNFGPGSLYLVNQSGRKVNPFGVKRKAQIDIDAAESPLYQTRTKEDVPFVSNEQVRNDVPKMDATTRQTEAKNIKIEPGMLVGSRININASKSLGYPVLTIHHTFDKGKPQKENPNASKGEAIGQRGNVTLSNVNFNVSQSERNKIAEGRAKGVMAMAVGRVMDVEPNFDGVELSFNPNREHLFVDSEGRAVKSAEEVTVMGFKAYARGKITYFEDFEDPRSPKYTAPSQTKFAKTKEELVKMADDVDTGNTTVEEVGVPELAPEVVAEAITAFSDAIENGSTIEEATEEVALILENSAEEGPRKVTPPSEKTEPVSANKKEEKPKAEKKEKVVGPILSDSETIVAFTIAGNAKSIMDTTGVAQADAVNEAVLEITNGDQESADRYLAQPGIKEAVNNKIKQIKAKTARELEAESPKITISERKLLLDRVKAEIKAALEGRKEGKKEGVEQATEKAQKTIDALNKKLEEGKITKQELQDRIKELGYNIRFEAGVARLAGEKTGKSMGKKFGEFVGYFKGLKAGRTEQRGLGALVSEYIKDVVDNEFGKKGTVSPATLKSIARRAATISNQKQLDAFVSYLDKVIANRRLAEGLNEIKKLQKQLLNKVGYQYTSNMKMFAKFDMFTADGDLAFDMLTMTEYLDALRDLTSDRVPKIGKMMELFDDMYDINQQNQPALKTAIDSLNEWQIAVNKLFNTAKDIIVQNNGVVDLAESFQNYRAFKSNVKKYTNALDELLVTGMISESDYERMFNDVIEKSAVTDTYASEFQDQIDELKKMLIDGITDKGDYGFMDSIKDWLSNSPNSFTENQKKLIDQLMRATPKNLMTLSLEDLDLLNQVTAQIAEAGFVDEKNLRTLLDRAEIRGNEVGKSLVEQSQKVRNKYSNPKNGYIKMMRDTLGKSVVFWESRLGMKENGAFRKHLIDPIVRAINGWEKDSQRILKDYQRKVDKIRGINILKKPSDIKKLINRTKIEKFKLTTDGTLVPNGTVKVSKDAYDRVMIGVVGHILNNAWNAKQKKKTVNDWLGKQILSAEQRNKMQNEDVNELDIVNNIYNDLKQMFPDGNGGLDHMAVLEAFESDPTSILTSNQLEYYKAAQSALQEAGEYINSASGIRNQQHETTPYYMPRQSIGTRKAALTSTDISYNKNVGPAIRSGASYQRVLQVPTEAIRYNIDRLVMTNVNEGLRDYYLTDAKRYVNEVFSNAQENAKSDEVVMLNNLKQLSDTIAPFALEKSKSTFGLSKLMGKFFVDALIGIVRTPVEFTTNLISYAVGNRSLRSLTLPFSPKEKQETDKLLSEFDSSVQFTGLEKKVKLSGKKGIDGYLDRESNFGLINKFLNNITGFMRKGEWMSQFERDFQNNTGEKFNYEKHFVKEKAKYYDDMKRAASDADFRMRRIMKGGNKAEQRQFIEWVPFVKKARISADSAAAPFVGMFSGFINHDADNLIGGMRKVITRGEIKDGLTQSLGAYSRLALYPVLMVIGKAIANLNLGDDDEKEEAQETLDSLKTTQGWIDMAIFSAKQVGATLFGGKYAAGGKIVGSLLLDAAYTISGMNGDRKQQRLIEDTMRELYFVDPIDFYNLPSEKDDIALQISANLEPIIGMAVNAVADFAKDVQNKGREQVTLYDIYEWTQQTEEGKQWMYMTNSLATLGQTLTVMFTPGAIPLIDDYVRWAEDELSQKEPNENTLYKTPGGEVIDMRDLFLDDSQRVPINTPGISTRERDKYSILATEKFNKAIEKEGKSLKDLFADEKYLQIDYLFNKAKYDAGSELGFPTERWSETEGEMVSGEPIPLSERDDLPESEVTLEKLHQQIIKGKQLSFVQNIKEKRKAEDYMFKELDKNPNIKNDYKNATIGGKLGVREYFKAKYLYDKYKLTEPPVSSNYFIKEKGKIKQVESMPTEEN